MLLLGHSNADITGVPIEDLFTVTPTLNVSVSSSRLVTEWTSAFLETMESLTSPDVERVATILSHESDDDTYRSFGNFARSSSWPLSNLCFWTVQSQQLV
jgi:hypothetical protein